MYTATLEGKCRHCHQTIKTTIETIRPIDPNMDLTRVASSTGLSLPQNMIRIVGKNQWEERCTKTNGVRHAL